jgi:threonylcarbamoyladenosine tRNA methylthiotransferase MtaB
VQTGCEERCAYCIIPSTRGPGRSLPIEAVVSEVRRIAAAGYKELALTGVHLGSFGRDLSPRRSLHDLLLALSRVDVDVTVRVSSLEPMDCTPEIVDLVAASGGRLAPHFHLPLQHASDRILGLMGRPYTLDHYARLADAIVAALPHASIGTDVIAGFPGEEAGDFDETLRYLSAAPLSHLHVFPYSDRPGTAASSLRGKVPGPAIRERASALRATGAELSRRFYRRQVGSVRPALTIGEGDRVVTDNYLKLAVPPGLARNERVRVRVGEALTGSVCG